MNAGVTSLPINKSTQATAERITALKTNTNRPTIYPTTVTMTTVPATSKTTTVQASPLTAVSRSTAHSGMNTDNTRSVDVHGTFTPDAVVLVAAEGSDGEYPFNAQLEGSLCRHSTERNNL